MLLDAQSLFNMSPHEMFRTIVPLVRISNQQCSFYFSTSYRLVMRVEIHTVCPV